MKKNQMYEVSGYHLKIIALLTMFIDHIGAVVLWRLLMGSYSITASMQQSEFLGDKICVWTAQHQEFVYQIYTYTRFIGRMAFPIYCFLLVEGFLHTRNVKKYILRLFLFALLSEIPFDFALEGTFWNPMYNNVFFTLLLGLLSISGLDYLQKQWEKQKEKKLYVGVMTVLVAVVGMYGIFIIAEEILCCDYGMAGIGAIVFLWVFRNQRTLGFCSAVCFLGIFSSSTELLAIAMLPFISNYNGTRGKQVKYFFYAFYPVHLFLLGLFCKLLEV